MSNVHHNTAYEEVKQGENNKKQSNKSMIQSKFIYLAFAIVFSAILVQGIVLYFVLKPSSSTKQQSLLVNKIIKSTCNQKFSEPSKVSSLNSSINLFGVTIDTSPLIKKIENSLTNYDKSTLGRAIRFKPNNDCLNGGLIANYSSGPNAFYKVYPAKCDGSPLQKWRKVGNKFHVGSSANYPKLGSSFTPCLDCPYDNPKCDLVVGPCNRNSGRIFDIRIFPSQIDFAQNRIYFTIHSSQFSNQCLGQELNYQYKVNVFHLDECHGYDEESFYLEDLDFAEEIEDIRIKISSALWLVLLGSEVKQHCP